MRSPHPSEGSRKLRPRGIVTKHRKGDETGKKEWAASCGHNTFTHTPNTLTGYTHGLHTVQAKLIHPVGPLQLATAIHCCAVCPNQSDVVL